ncbi:glycerophosphodiester phosphodiesterase family protein [Shimia biformata]|uniref:glycerophosphodiester phosphodiesterase family protein n=1 Tax=Shimia biformata TaxID=1294299 RepID=UPI00194F7620|nr:glycerophosphodiester phosphodiesterase family protein [Shimia biformata]
MTRPALPSAFLSVPLAHRALHNVGDGRPENSRAAVRAALQAGYGIEIDVQLSADGQAMVFHDYHLARLTAQTGPIRQRTSAELAGVPLTGGDEGIPTLPEILSLVAGKVPLLVEIKDQDGALGVNVGQLEQAVGAALADYAGPVAVMSFNPHSVAAMAWHAPDVARGLVTEAFAADEWPLVPATTRERLAGIPDFEAVGASFVSHDRKDLTSPAVAALKARAVPVLCWTVRSPEEEATARRIADNITFEGYTAPFPA